MKTKTPIGMIRLPALVAAMVLTVTGCGGDESAAPDATPTTEDTAAASPTAATTGTAAPTPAATGDPETTEVSVGVLPIIDVAPLYIASEEGYFEEEGLTVTPEIAQGGAAIVSSVVGGERDIGFSAYTSFFQAITEGIGLQVIAEGNRATPDFSGVYVMPDSPISEPADLVGATVSVPTLNSIGPLSINAVLDDMGVDYTGVNYTELPFPDAPGALERGDTDAAMLVEPFTTSVRAGMDGRQVIDNFSGPTEELPVGGYGTTSEFAEANPNTMAAFQRAMERAAQLANENPDRVREALLSYTSIPEEAVAEVTLPRFVSAIDQQQLQRFADLMVDYELLPEELDVSPHLVVSE